MLESNSTSHVFRFTALRPPNTVDAQRQIGLSDSTPLVKSIADAPRRGRREIAQAYIRDEAAKINAFITSDAAVALAKAIDKVSSNDGKVSDLKVFDEREALQTHGDELSDYLLASKFGRIGEDTGQVTPTMRFYRALCAWRSPVLAKSKLADVLKLPIVLPSSLTATPVAARSATTERALASALARPAGATSSQGRLPVASVPRVLNELAMLHRSDFLTTPVDAADAEVPPMVLNAAGASMLSQDANNLLRSLDINPLTLPIYSIVTRLESLGGIREGTMSTATPTTTSALPSAPGQVGESGVVPRIQASAVADLLILKQHLTGYVRTDISHVENIMAGETKGTNFRNFERTDQTFTSEVEDTTEKQDELTTDERFDLKDETDKTIKEDQKIGFGLTVSGKYGPSVEFNASSSLDLSTSTEQSEKTAVDYAKDILERSLQKVTHKVRTQQVLEILREQEETNTHALTNSGTTHIVGLYQYLEKEYQSQVFNYGLRQTFDFIVPEPASFTWWVEQGAAVQPDQPAPPARLDSYISCAEEVDESNYLPTAAILGASDLSPPPPMYTMVTAAVKHGDTSGSEEDQPRSIMEKEIPIPAGYAPFWARVMPTALTDDQLTLAITVGTAQWFWRPAAPDVGSDFNIGSGGMGLSLADMSFSQDVESRLFAEVLAFESDSYDVVYNVIFARTPEAYTAWQISTYATLQAAWQNKQAKYEEDLQAAQLAANAQAQQATPLESSPSQNAKIIRSELKKHCISILTQQRYDDFVATQDGAPPFFDFQEAADEGSFIRFFEQAFEWDQLQYVCYPYFWGRKSTWAARYNRNDIDPDFLDYLQAGAARVVTPVRPGFEAAVAHYLETDEIWNGEGEPLEINSPLYVSILEELKARAEAPGSETAVGDPWSTSVPTPLVILRTDEGLPAWERQSPDSWVWVESPPA